MRYFVENQEKIVCKIPFVQEVQSAFGAIKKFYPDADAAVELGGEDAKIIFVTGGSEQRMNGSCAGGTGATLSKSTAVRRERELFP